MTYITIDTIIIGAGIAGLYYVYKSKINDYLILEKNDRIGGRIYNIKWNNEQISLGGGVIKEDNHNTLTFVKELKLENNLLDFTSIYHFVDLKGNEPNENLYHKSNKTIIDYLRKVFNEKKDEIKNLSLTFKQFLLYYLDYNVYKIVHDSILYKSYMDADVNYVLQDENIYELLRVSEFKLKSLKNGGYNLLINKLLEKLGNYKNKIKLNCNIIKISKINNNFIIENSNGEKYNCNKLVIATPKNNNIQFDFYNTELINRINNIYNSIDGKPYIRVYTYHEKGHGIKNSMFTSNIPGKVIIMSDKIIMACYTENANALELYNLLYKNNKNKELQINIVYNLLKNSNIHITKPDDIIYKFWDIGTHYINPNINYNKLKKNIQELTKENIILIGELFARNHGWVDSAIESVNNILL
jgi:monoamine oxidase